MADSSNPLEERRYLELVMMAEAGHVDEALAILDRFLESGSATPELKPRIWAAKALFAARAGRDADAVNWYRVAIEHQPTPADSIWIQSGLAESLATLRPR